MKWNDLRIGTRLGIGFALVLALLASVMAGGNMARERAMQQLGQGMRDVTTKTALADRMKTALLEGALFTRNIALQGDVAATQAEEEKVKAQRRRYAEARDQLAARGLSQAEKDILAEIDRLDQETREPMLEAVGQSLLFNVEEAAKVISMRIDPVQRRMIERINQLTLLQQDAAGELMERTADAARRLDALLYGLGALALVLGVLFSTAITRSITGPLRGAVAVARKVADGDLSSTIEAKGRDETGQLLQALQDMTGKLRTLVGDVAAGAHTVADTSGQIAHGNLDLSQRTEEQASTLEETASSMEELTSTVAQNAENARQASRLAQEASEIARRGGKVVGDVVSTMTGISDASRRIAHILGVIDGIAFQTNILALNAAVEAARAGDQGRGFAVVAAEVRGLAQRSAEAAKEIKTLIADSVDKVDAGARLVDTAGRTMQEIVGAAKQVSDLVAEIAAASQEQRSGIEQVNTAMAQMDQAVQQNASLVEEAAASTESLKEQAVALLQNVARFRLGAVDAAPEGLLRAEPAMALAAAPEPIRVRGRRAAALGAAAAGAIGVTAAAHAGQ